MKEKFWTIPNVLSLCRLAAFPFIIWWIFSGNQQLVSVFIALGLVTDLLDGIIARVFNMKTAIGARLDSWADTGIYICAFLAIYFFKWTEVEPHLLVLLIFFTTWLLSYAVVFIKFKGLIGLHTYFFKLTGYLQGAFIVVLFTWGFYPWLFYISLTVGTLACVEEIIIILLIKKPMMNVKGLYWIIKNHFR